MDVFISTVTYISSIKLSHYSISQIETGKCLLQNWKNNPNKHEVNGFYENSLFCILYVKDLYSCRVSSFCEVLKSVSRNNDVKQIMNDTVNIVSIGCGPGPEIAAYTDFVRNECSNNLFLYILGIDTVSHWSDFILASANCGRNIHIDFQNAYVNTKFLVDNSVYGVCLMSYPEAINFDRDFWNMLKIKFDLVIITDQSKPSLFQNLSNCGYTIHSIEFKGSKKYAFYVNSSRRPTDKVEYDGVTKILIPDVLDEKEKQEEEEEEEEIKELEEENDGYFHYFVKHCSIL